MPELKTKPTIISTATFLAAVEPQQRQAEGRALDNIFRRVTGWEPRMWGATIIGYGRYRYVYDSGHSGEMCATGFSPRKADLVLYVLSGADAQTPLLARLGKHRTGKSCLYIKRLTDVNEDVLSEIIRTGLEDLQTRWPVDAG